MLAYKRSNFKATFKEHGHHGNRRKRVNTLNVNVSLPVRVTPPYVNCEPLARRAWRPGINSRRRKVRKNPENWKVLWVGLIHRPRNNLVLWSHLPRCLSRVPWWLGKKSHLSLLPLWDRLLEFLVKVWVIPTHCQIPINFSDDTSGSLHLMHIQGYILFACICCIYALRKYSKYTAEILHSIAPER